MIKFFYKMARTQKLWILFSPNQLKTWRSQSLKKPIPLLKKHPIWYWKQFSSIGYFQESIIAFNNVTKTKFGHFFLRHVTFQFCVNEGKLPVNKLTLLLLLVPHAKLKAFPSFAQCMGLAKKPKCKKIPFLLHNSIIDR